jgi:uncharacterized repeat protein (TIGR02543 family)
MVGFSTRSRLARVLALGCLLCARASFGQAGPDVLSLSSGTAAGDGTVALNLVLTSPAGSEPTAIQWTLTYPPSSVVALSVSAGAAASAAAKTLTCTTSSGTYTCLAWGLNDGIVSNGIVAVVNATMAIGATITSIGVSSTVASSTSAEPVPLTALGGTVTGGALPAVSSLACVPATLSSSSSATCVVTLNGPAPSGGAAIALTNTNTALTVPIGVAVAPAATSASFTVSTGVIGSNQSATVAAIYNNTSASTSVSLTATQYQLTISASPPAGGTVTPATGGPYNSGANVPITATPNSGFQFASWSGGVANSSSTSTTVTMNAAETVTANFTALTGITFQTNPAGLQFTVDGGAAQVAPQTLSLTQGIHMIAVATTQPGGPPFGSASQYVFTAWSDAGAASHSITVGPAVATYTASFQTQYQLTISASPVAGATVTPASGNFYNSGSSVAIAATANPGYTFSGWTGTVANAASASTSVTMGGPQTVVANFSALTGITILTNPAGLQFTVDGGVAETAPQTLNLSQGTHTIAVVTTQPGGAPYWSASQYIFTAWSDAGPASHSITVGPAAATYTANFKTQYQLTISASPAAGATLTPASGSFYDSGSSVAIAATANPGYTFSGWTGTVANAGSAATSVTMGAPQSVVANFSPLTPIAILTNPAGLQFTVDGGVAETAPQTLNLSQGNHTVAVALTQAGGVPAQSGTQYTFNYWSDGGAVSHIITVGASAATYTATFAVQYLLTTTVSPAGAGSLAVNPSEGGYYNPETSVQLTASPNPGYQFNGWAGDLSGSANPQSISMNQAHSVIANFGTPSCSTTLMPTGVSLPATGTSTMETCPNSSGQPNCGVFPEAPLSFTVSASAVCGPWTATSSNPGVLQIASGGGTGAGSVAFVLLNNTHTTQQSETITVASAAASTTYTITEAGSGDSQVYREIYALYEQLLGRDPDSGGFAFWTGMGGAGLGQMADSFLTSPEAFNRDFAVIAAYQGATGAPPTYTQYVAAVASVQAGAQTVNGLFNSLVVPGYTATTLYQNLLNRQPDAGEISSAGQAGLATWFETLVGYPCTTTPIGSSNNEFQSTGTYQTTLAADHTNSLYVQMLYYVIFSRDPDPAGLAFWLSIANGGGPGVLFQGSAGYATRIQILGPGTPNQGFIGSPEFQNLFAN